MYFEKAKRLSKIEELKLLQSRKNKDLFLDINEALSLYWRYKKILSTSKTTDIDWEFTFNVIEELEKQITILEKESKTNNVFAIKTARCFLTKTEIEYIENKFNVSAVQMFYSNDINHYCYAFVEKQNSEMDGLSALLRSNNIIHTVVPVSVVIMQDKYK